MRNGLMLAATVVLGIGIRAQTPMQEASTSKPSFVGSASCRSCHQEEYDGWKQTRMANVVRDPRKHSEAVLGDFSHPNPNVTFDLSQVAFVYGSRWKQRYFTKRGNDYYVLPAQWDIKHSRWLPYHVEAGADWWVPFYPSSNNERPTGPLCDGCHSVNYNLQTKQPTEWNVGCEKCHGPGSEHVAHPRRDNIVNPAKLDFVRGNDVCIQCHSQGRPVKNPIEGKYFDWPVGFLPGQRLSDVWNLEERTLGKTDFFYWADGTAHKNRMQGNDFAQSVMYHRDIRCFDCHDVHSNKNPSDLIGAGNELCLGCHNSKNPAGLHGTVSEHTHHAASSAGSQCIACHMPQIEQTLGDNFVASHTFRFISPKLTERFGVPNPCTSCHKDKSTQWALTELRSWKTTSPWRVLQ
ncbi:MAG: cytochrome c3 family protein [Blastocatellia bacterium]